MKKILALVFCAMLLSAGCNTSTSNPAGNNNQAPTPTPTVANKIFKNAFMQFEYPEGWAPAEVAKSPSKVNITKGNYVLFINADVSQASGVVGGRFAEIAQGSPSADAVMLEQPSPPCGTTETIKANETLLRNDLYVKSQGAKEYCRTPKNGKNVWYFSYINTSEGGYINYYKDSVNKGYVITMSYKSTDVNMFPAKDDPELTSALDEMTGITNTLVLQKK